MRTDWTRQTTIDPSVLRHYRRLRGLTWDREDHYPMPAHLAYVLARDGMAAQAFDWEESTPTGDGWTYYARREYDDEGYPYEDECPLTHVDAFAMYRSAGQSRARAATYARAALEAERERITHSAYVVVSVEVTGPNGEHGSASLCGVDCDESDPLSDGYLVDCARELIDEARWEAELPGQVHVAALSY